MSTIQPNLDLPLSEFLALTPGTVPFLVEPFLPAGGVVFLHGPTSVGKSPLTWAIATAVSNGGHCFGFPVLQTGKVLYIELDTPAHLLHPRLTLLETLPTQFHLSVFNHTINILALRPEDGDRLRTLSETLNPALVIVNTLRKSHELDDKDSEVPARIYTAWRMIFPSSTLMFVHHDKKDPSSDVTSNPDQAFSGSQAWANDAQVALHITRGQKVRGPADEEGHSYERTRVTVKMTKSQVSDHERFHPISLQLSSDGTNWIEAGPVAYRKYFLGLDPIYTRAKRIQMTIDQFEVGKSSVYEAVRGLA